MRGASSTAEPLVMKTSHDISDLSVRDNGTPNSLTSTSSDVPVDRSSPTSHSNTSKPETMETDDGISQDAKSEKIDERARKDDQEKLEAESGGVDHGGSAATVVDVESVIPGAKAHILGPGEEAKPESGETAEKPAATTVPKTIMVINKDGKKSYMTVMTKPAVTTVAETAQETDAGKCWILLCLEALKF